jgi:hypothetical protein
MPMARFRLRPSGKLVAMSDSAVGEAMAAPTPWAPRVRMSHVSLEARPPNSEATAKMAMPAMNIRRLPNRSPVRPPNSSRPPKVSE